ncbi:zinc carboxypeptidase-like [Babylonia areolata]|uniref:zinc carboxypeptidase-like n=1 Tax=Babylonia areolata TaxID=304850 RepID=UPI003FD537DA
MRVFALACLLLVGNAVGEEVKKSYRGYHVLSAEAATKEHLSVLRHLKDSQEVMFLSEPSLVISTDMVVSPEEKGKLMDALKEAGITVKVQSSDLQADIDAEMRESQANQRKHHDSVQRNGDVLFEHNYYRRLVEVNELMYEFAARYPNLAVMKWMDHETHEGRTVYYIEIGTQSATDKDVIFIEGLAHSREWIATASLLYTMDKMLKMYNVDPIITEALTKYTWVIIPVVNPDGYEYTWNYDRMWRKNRNPIHGANCKGVDLNRNYDMMFGSTGVSHRCSDDTYLGKAPFSEPETQNVRDLFLQLKPRIVSFLSVHAYSQLLLHPWGYINSNNPSDKPENIDKLIAVGKKMQAALQSLGRRYALGTPYQVLGYGASGAAEDWALQEKPGIYSYCYELRPRTYWEGHFVLDPKHIIPTGHELLQSLLVLMENIYS